MNPGTIHACLNNNKRMTPLLKVIGSILGYRIKTEGIKYYYKAL